MNAVPKEGHGFRRSGQEGAMAVELALALPILLLIIFGIFQLVFIVNTRTILDHAAYEGMRTAIVINDRSVALRRVRQIVSASPKGSGFLVGEPKLSVEESGKRVTVIVVGKMKLLPFIRQTTAALGGSESIGITVRASGRREPYVGL